MNNAVNLFSGIYKSKKVLVTGDTGFKGSWLCIWLLELGAEVYGYALAPQNNNDNYISSALSKRMHHQDGDIRDKEKLSSYLNKVQPEIVFHLAAQPLVIESYNTPHYTFETNVMGTVNLLEAIKNCSAVKSFINVTTDKCYQNNEWIWPYRENEPLGGHDPYSASKACSELVTKAYIQSFFNSNNSPGIATARAGNVIGGGDWSENRIIPDSIRAFKSNQELVIRNPSSVRPWQFVLEPLYGYLKLAEQLYQNPRVYSGAWNFGPTDYESYNVEEVIKEIKKLIPQLNVSIQDKKTAPHEAQTLKLDVSKAVNELFWHPKLNFKQSIQYTIDGYIKELEQPLQCYEKRVEQIINYCKL